MLNLRIARGRSLPLGASAQPDGVNFALLSRHATAVHLVVYPLDGAEPLAEVALHPKRNRSGSHWHVLGPAGRAPPALLHAPQRLLPPPLPLAGGRAAPDPPGRHRHLRAARPRLHLPPLLPGGPPGHLRRPGREDPLPESPGRDGRG